MNINSIMDKVIAIIKRNIKNNLVKIILFGSYARGEETKSSDIDLLVLTQNNREEAYNTLRQFSEELYDIELNEKIMINPLVENIEFYNTYKNSLPLFMNIEKEGVLIYE